mgnify:CR=1 FL=1
MVSWQVLLERIRTLRVLVVGDLCLDVYLFGEPTRVSREAPILVLEERRQEVRPGGGAAPALALAALGVKTWQVGVVGNDDAGRQLVQLLADRGVDPRGVLVDPDRPTTCKTRVVAEGPYNVFPQQIARIDRQDRRPVPPHITQQMIDVIAQHGPMVDAILLSDYRSGVIEPAIVEAARAANQVVTVDSQGRLDQFHGCTVVKCNQAEAEHYLGVSLSTPSLREVHLHALRENLNCTLLVVTLGPAGAALVTSDGRYHEQPPRVRRQVFDVTGAGDTVIAVFTAALAAGADPVAALELSQVAAGIVVSKWGNVQATTDELREALADDPPDCLTG